MINNKYIKVLKYNPVHSHLPTVLKLFNIIVMQYLSL